MSKVRRELEAVIDALDEVPVDDRDAHEVVETLGIDVKSLAEKVRGQVAAADARDRDERVQQARRAYAADVERLERRKTEPKRSREVQIGIYRALLAKAPPDAVTMHFHKFETATDEELAELIRALRHLLGEDDTE